MRRKPTARMPGLRVLAGWCLLSLAGAGVSAAQPAGAPDAPDRALIDRYCVTCHNERLLTGGLALDTLDITDVGAAAGRWEAVVEKLRGGMMPPAGRPRPEPAAYDGFRRALEAALDRAAADNPEPGRVPTHRLNRAEYANAVRDLLALEIDGAALLPADVVGHGFDNLAGTLAVSPRADGPLPVRGPQDQPPRGRGPDHRPRLHVARLHGADQHDAERPDERGPAVRVARGHRRPPPLSARRRVRHPHPPQAQRLRVHRQPGGGARPGGAARRPAAGVVHRGRGGARQAGAAHVLRDVRGGRRRGVSDPGLGRLLHRRRRRPGAARNGRSGHAGGRRLLRRQVVGGGRGPAAAAAGVRRHRHRADRHVAAAGRARHRERFHRRSVQPGRRGLDGQPPADLQLPAGVGRRRGSRALRPDDILRPRAARLPAAGDRPRRGAAHAVLRDRLRRRWFRRRYPGRAGAAADRSGVPVPDRAGPGRRGARRHLPARRPGARPRGSRSSSGAAFPTTSCWMRRCAETCTNRTRWSGRCGGCWPTPAPRRWWRTSPTSG